MKTMSWAFHGRVSVTVHGARSPSNEEWDEYVRAFQALEDVDALRVVVVSYGGGPSGPQRQKLVGAMKIQTAPTAVLTSSRVMRGVGTAISWFNRDLRVYALDELGSALGYLGLDDAERRAVRTAVARLESDLGIPSGHAESL